MNTVLFLHRGTSWYLYYAVKQARAAHPGARLVVLSDNPQSELRRYAEILPLADYWAEAEAFAPLYVHHSTNSVAFERLCFQRWFAIDAFLRRHRPERFLYLDSDVLCYDNLLADCDRPGDWQLSVVDRQGPFTMLVRDPAAIALLCRHITTLFAEEAHTFPALMAEWNRHAVVAAVTDMYALHTCLERHRVPHLELSLPYQGTTYDTYLDHADGFATDEHGYKRIAFVDRRPFGTLAATGERIRFKTLHCHGAAKHRIVRSFTARDLGYYRDRLLAKLLRR